MATYYFSRSSRPVVQHGHWSHCERIDFLLQSDRALEDRAMDEVKSIAKTVAFFVLGWLAVTGLDAMISGREPLPRAPVWIAWAVGAMIGTAMRWDRRRQQNRDAQLSSVVAK